MRSGLALAGFLVLQEVSDGPVRSAVDGWEGPVAPVDGRPGLSGVEPAVRPVGRPEDGQITPPPAAPPPSTTTRAEDAPLGPEAPVGARPRPAEVPVDPRSVCRVGRRPLAALRAESVCRPRPPSAYWDVMTVVRE